MPTALVIGDSAGIGQAIVRRLVADGYTVTGLARREPTFSHERYTHAHADVRADPAVLRAELAQILDKLGTPLDVCIYASGIGHFLDFADMTHEADVFTTNLTGLAVVAEAVLPRMVAAKHGHFVGLSSQGDTWIDEAAPSYSASKAGMSSYLHGLAFACRKHGVAVTNIRFGFVDTEMSRINETRPFLITADKAAHIVARCLIRRPIRYTYPKRMAALLWLGLIPRRLRILLS
jgi:NAD(P)-dependent dehydrogenase (short-subunit alcohol dehydrogenase family)